MGRWPYCNEYDVFAESSLFDDIGPFDSHTFPTCTKLSQKASKQSLAKTGMSFSLVDTSSDSSSSQSVSSLKSALYVLSNLSFL